MVAIRFKVAALAAASWLAAAGAAHSQTHDHPGATPERDVPSADGRSLPALLKATDDSMSRIESAVRRDDLAALGELVAEYVSAADAVAAHFDSGEQRSSKEAARAQRTLIRQARALGERAARSPSGMRELLGAGSTAAARAAEAVGAVLDDEPGSPSAHHGGSSRRHCGHH